MQMTGNTILITGGTSGIGRALAEQFHARGNKVIVAGRRQHLLDEIEAAHPGIDALPLDVTDIPSIAPFAARIRERYPQLNVLINNAGISRQENLAADAIDLSVAQAMIDVNVVSVLHLTAAFLPTLKQQPQATIIATSSGLAFIPRANFSTYCASKAFLHSWLQSLRSQLRGSGVEVLELAPPYVQTELGGPQQLRDPHAMPLAEYIDEVIGILERADTPGGEILVDRVKMLRWAERNGNYEQLFKTLNP